ncbi:kallikrein-4-like [Lycorma delicatula]|uniref:kallikrein-4-like n=1 Tax=Lycorma delicatula TaxID=130591 RepID=UPI003F50EB30
MENKEKRILGGKQASLGQLPHCVYLEVKGTVSCTGAIIHEEWVLTAAHCVVKDKYDVAKPGSVIIEAGRTDGTFSPYMQIRRNERIVCHKDYDTRGLASHDISLINLDEPFLLTPVVNKVGFYNREWPKGGIWKECEAAGFGQTEEGKSGKLMYLNTIAKHGRRVCPCIDNDNLLQRIICLPPLLNEGPCFGDSGGALLCRGEIVGVAHTGLDRRFCSSLPKSELEKDCGSVYVYGVYMYTCPYLDWISKHVPGIPKKPRSCKGTLSSSPPKIANIIFFLFFTL